MKTYAIVLAGGRGTRMKMATPKQYLKLAGRAVLSHTIDALDHSRFFDEIILVTDQDNVENVRHDMASARMHTPVRVVEGGSTRNESASNGLAAIDEDEAKVLIHDAVRPFVNRATLSRVIDALDTEEAVDTAIPTADTIIRVTDDMYIDKIPRRDVLYRGQTPQGFRLSGIRDAYRQAVEAKTTAYPDDCSVYMAYHPQGRVKVVLGDSTNMKLTDQVDLSLAEKIFQLRKAELPTITHDELKAELAGKTMVVFGSSSGIGESIIRLAREYGASVYGFSRSETQTFVEDEASVRAAIATVLEADGKVDYVINTVGLLELAPITELSSAAVIDLLNTNFLGHVNIVRATIEHLRANNGVILGFGSSSYSRGRANYALYSSSKAALVNFTQAIAEEEPQVRINIVSPERTKTPMRVNAFGDEAGVSMLTADDVALETLRTLLADETGSVIDVKLGADEGSMGISS